MPKEKITIEPVSNARVNLHNEEELPYWMEKFNCSREELVRAVNAVGNSARKVKRYLEKSRDKT